MNARGNISPLASQPPPPGRIDRAKAWLRARRPGLATWWVAGYSLFYLAIHTRLKGNRLVESIDTASFLPVSLIAAVVLFAASRSTAVPGFRRGFHRYGISMALTAVGNVIWATQQYLGYDATYSWSNLPSLVSYGFAVTGLMALPVRLRSRADAIRLALDACVALVAGAAIVWLLVIAPLSEVDPDPLHTLITLLYPIGDLVLFAALMPVLLTSGEDRTGVLSLFTLGQATYLLGDLGYQLGGNLESLGGFIWPNVPYLLGYTLMTWSAEYCHRISPAATAPPIEDGQERYVPRNPVPLVLGAAVFLLLITMGEDASANTRRVLTAAALLTTAILLAREIITERQNRSLRRALNQRQADERFASSIQHVHIGILVYSDQGIVLNANRAALEMLGVAESEIVGRRVIDLPFHFLAEDGGPLTAETSPSGRAFRTGVPVRDVVISMERSGGSSRKWHLVDAEPELNAAGAVTRVVVSFHDITERRELETQLRQAQRMEAVGQLAGGVAHDFNNLLTAIAGYCSTLLEQLPDGPHRDDVKEIDRAADRAAELTRQLLAFGRRQILQPRVLDVGEVVRSADRLLRRLLREDIEILLDLPGTSPVLVDRGQLEQVIVNLAVNARDAMPQGGRLTIAIRELGQRPAEMPAGLTFPDQGAVMLSVKDTGIGMNAATAARAFEPFFTTKEVGKGTGLGLATVYGIARQSGGEAWIESHPGQGTTILVLLPRTAPSAPTAPEPVAPVRAGGTETVLVVEDEPSLLLVVRRSLQRQGYTVKTAGGTIAAREVLGSTQVDLLITDVIMPGGSGSDLAVWAQAMIPGLPVLFMTGYADEAILHSVGELPNHDLIRKPFQPSQLVSRVRDLLDRTVRTG